MNMTCTIFDELIGKVFTKIEGAEEGSYEIRFTTTDGHVFLFYHEQDCCEDVQVEDVGGNIDDLIGSPMLVAEEVTNEGDCDGDNTCTWTWYHFATIKGYVSIRWFGTSNGYYSECVNHKWEK